MIPTRSVWNLFVSLPSSVRPWVLVRGWSALAILVLSGASLCYGQGTYTAASCAESDVNAVIKGPTHTAVSGDTIIIPTTGSPCTWASGITISGVGIDITGTGSPNAGGGTVGAGTPSTTLIESGSSPFFTFTNLSVGQTAKVELLNMGSTNATKDMVGAIVIWGTCTTSGCAQFRVDNINFTAGEWESGLDSAYITMDDVFGVADHNTANESVSSSPALVDINYTSWQGVGDWGDNSFASADTLGMAGAGQATYIENNLVTGVRLSEVVVSPPGLNAGGGRYVCRFNVTYNMSGTGICNGHGTAWSGRNRGMRQVEAYYNTTSCSNASCNAGTGVLSGTGYFFSNYWINTAVQGWNTFIDINIPRFDKTASPWGNCDGTEPWDHAPWSSTTACLDQPGSGAGLLYTANNPPTMASAPGTACTAAGQCWPNPALDPIYEAGETGNVPGTPGYGFIAVASNSQTRLLANRDYYAEVSQLAQTSATSPFNGTTGTGYGTLANRPTTCTPYVGYWATDQGSWNTSNSSQEGELFICTSTNTWTMKYEPYTYPHPLTTGGTLGSGDTPPNAPTDLTAAVE
jgi:hypothetical protein